MFGNRADRCWNSNERFQRIEAELHMKPLHIASAENFLQLRRSPVSHLPLTIDDSWSNLYYIRSNAYLKFSYYVTI